MKHLTIHPHFAFFFSLKFGQCNSSNISIFYSQIRSFKIKLWHIHTYVNPMKQTSRARTFCSSTEEKRIILNHPEWYIQTAVKISIKKRSFCEPSTILVNIRFSEDLVSCGSRKYWNEQFQSHDKNLELLKVPLLYPTQGHDYCSPGVLPRSAFLFY